MDSYLIDNQRKHVCGNNPACDGYEIEEGEFRLKGYDGPVVECDKCGSEMHLKMGRFGKYMGCTNENCKTPARSCVTAMSRRRRKIRCRCRSCRARSLTPISCCVTALPACSWRPTPSLNRARPVRRWWKSWLASDRLPEKLRYLADAPVSDAEGNKRWCVSAVKPNSIRLF